MKNLALVFCSVRPIQLPENVCDAREEEYLICLNQLKRVVPESFDLIVCENTIDDIEKLKNQEFKDFLKNNRTNLTGSKSNIGTHNKGRGELLMLKNALDLVEVSEYDKISYITGRKFFTCPYVFERTESLQKQALISNPDFVFLNGNFIESTKRGLYNDMFFSMSAKLMVEYSSYAMGLGESVGSEQALHNFINSNNIEYEWLNWLGIVRNDWNLNNKTYDINNFHIC